MTRTTDRTKTLALLAMAAMLLAACGQSGPLYLPGNPSRVQVEPPDAEPDADEPAEDEEVEARQ